MTMINNKELNELISLAVSAFEGLSPEEKEAHRREQAIDWAYGELKIKYGDNPPITRERVGEIYDQRKAKQKNVSED